MTPGKAKSLIPELPKGLTLDQRAGYTWRQDWVNRKYLKEQDQLPQAKTFADGLEFMRPQ